MRYSISELFETKVNNWSEFWFLLGDFIDDFKKHPDYSRIEVEPIFFETIMSPFLAASIEALAYELNLPIPDWVFRKQYYLKDPYFAGGFKGEYNIFLLRESPLEFRSRNTFVSSNVLSRC